jgi:hypothetical protein
MTTTEITRTVTVFGLVAAPYVSPEQAPAW